MALATGVRLGDQGGYRLWLRSLEAAEAQPLNGTDGGAFPFWSPDSKSIAFFAAGKLKKMNLSGGPPAIICDAADGRGGTWNRENVIVFAASPRGVLQRVSVGGARPVEVDLQLMSAAIDTKDGFRRETPVAHFAVPTGINFSVGRQYAVSRDGQRFLVNIRQRTAAGTLTVIVNWTAAIGK